MWEKIKALYNKITASSANPEQTSAAIKGGLKIFVAQVIHAATVACSLGVACALGDLSWLNGLADGIGIVVYGGLLVWGGVQMIFGIGRKIYFARWSHPNA